MKSLSRLIKYQSGVRASLAGLMVIMGLGMASGASAITGDDPYFELYPVADGGDAESVYVCGVAGCDASLDMLVTTVSITPAGSGVRDTFLRLQNDNANITTETAYNTDDTTLQDDGTYTNGAKDTTAGNRDDFNNAVLISDLLIVDGYYQILLDVNEPGGGKEFIRLDEFEVHTSSTGSLGEFQGFETTGIDSGDADLSFLDADYQGKRFDMDVWSSDSGAPCTTPGDDGCGGMVLSSLQDGGGRNGSGDEDYVFMLPVALFQDTDVYLHIAATFGEADCGQKCSNSDPVAFAESGFEEFAAVLGPNPDGPHDVPVPATALLLGLGLAELYRRRRNPAAS